MRRRIELPLVIALCGLLSASSADAAAVFGDLTNHEAGVGPVWVGAADVDGDGDADMVGINECWCSGTNDHTIAVLRNDGAGNFPSSAPVADRYSPPFSPGIADFCDFDCDGDIDLVVTGSWENHGGVFALANDGAGHFTLAQTVRQGSYAHDVVAQVVSGDFDADGDPDLALSDEAANSVMVFMNASCASFVAGGSYAAGSGPLFLCTGDLDGDGDLDVAVTHRSSNDVTLLVNDGSGTFAVSSGFPTSPGAVGVIATADLNGDHESDLVIASPLYDSVTVLMNSGTGTFGPPTSYYVPDGPGGVVLADLDLDGHVDVATKNYFSYDVSVLVNDGLGGLLPPVSYSLGTPPYGPWWICGADFERDGDVDLAVANYNGGVFQVLRNQHCGMMLDLCPYAATDVNCDGVTNVVDVVIAVNSAFREAPEPAPCCTYNYGSADLF